MNLILAQSRAFNSVVCDLWKNENGDVFMTIDQLAQALDYADRGGVENIINRNEYLKDIEFSTTHKMKVVEGKREVMRERRIFTEDGIYEITMLSKQPKAKEFRAFVRKFLKGLRSGELQVIPSQQKLPGNYKEALLALVQEVEKNEQLEIEKQMYQQQVADMQPIMTYVDEVLKCTDLLVTSQIAEDYGMSAITFNKLLHTHGIQHKSNGQWLLYTKHKGQGYTKSETMEYQRPDGTKGVKLHTKWTQKGRLFLYENLKSKGVLPTMEQMKLKLVQ